MKYIALSFDDARSDTYEVAKPIMDKYGFTGTVNVITNFVFHPECYDFATAPRAMTVEQLRKWSLGGGETACHGSTHNNTTDDILKNIKELDAVEIDVSNIGFASPFSYLTEEIAEESGIIRLKENGTLSYIRTGIQVRREGFLYTLLSIAEQYTHSCHLYYFLNKRNIVYKERVYRIYPSAAVKDFTSVRQLQYLVENIPDGNGLIIMFHSVLEKGSQVYGKDHYFWDATRFETFCKWMKSNMEIEVINTIDMVKRFDFRK